MKNIEMPVYFPSVKKTAKENGLIQIGSNLFELGLASELNESERVDLKQRCENISAAFREVFYFTDGENALFDFSNGIAQFQFQNVYSKKTGKLRYRVYFLTHLVNTRNSRSSIYDDFKPDTQEYARSLEFNSDSYIEI